MTTTTSRSLGLVSTRSSHLPTSTFAACTWTGHCLGATCSTNDDCDQDWICVSQVCSPCCDDSGTSSITSSASPTASASAATSVASSATSSTTSTTALPTKSHKLDTAAAIGIGVGIVVCVIVGAGLGYWIWRLRKRKHRDAWTGRNNNEGFGSQVDTLGSRGFGEDRKRLVGGREAYRGELEDTRKPTELSSVELVEMEGDSGWAKRTGDDIQKSQRVHLTSPYTSPPTSPRTSHSSLTPQRRKISILPPERAVPRARYKFEEYTVSPEASSPGLLLFSPVSEGTPSLHASAETSTRSPGHTASKHTSLGSDAVFIAGDGPEEAYTLFRWPDSAAESSGNASR